jgi:hypothetical protein
VTPKVEAYDQVVDLGLELLSYKREACLHNFSPKFAVSVEQSSEEVALGLTDA